MTETFTFANTEAGLGHALCLTLSLRRAGFKTRVVETFRKTTPLLILLAVPAPRPNRKTRGCSGR